MTEKYFDWWKFDNVISPEDCKKLISLGDEKWQSGVVGHTHTNKLNKTLRDSEVVWVRDTNWKDFFWRYMHQMNMESGLNFHIDGVDHLQLTKYVAPAGHYDYHIDGNGFTEVNSRCRKISMTCLLNDDFEGGEFYFRIATEFTVPMKKGDLIFFPSYFPHTVTPVTKGTRYSLVAWFVGNPLT